MTACQPRQQLLTLAACVALLVTFWTYYLCLIVPPLLSVPSGLRNLTLESARKDCSTERGESTGLGVHPNEARVLFNCTARSSTYVLALSYRDQLTSSLRRLGSLQCWAGQFNGSVVEPFLPRNSTFAEAPPFSVDEGDGIRLRDIFDIEHWNNVSVHKHSFAPLVSREEFLACAPREVIAVDILYGTNGGQNGRDSGCSFPEFQQHWPSHKESGGYQLVRKVCVNMTAHGKLSTDKFNAILFGKLSRNVTIVFDTWRGIRNSLSEADIGLIMDTTCTTYTGRVASFSGIIPSSEIVRDAYSYRQRYFNGKSYYTIMLRMEQTVIYYREGVGKCLADIKEMLRCITMNAVDSNKKIFLSVDVGKYGTHSLVQFNVSEAYVRNYVDEVLSIVFGQGVSLESYERRFEPYTLKHKNPLYIATVQKQLAAGGECLWAIGGGTFQQQAIEWYYYGLEQGHRDDPCVVKLKPPRMCRYSSNYTCAPLHTRY